MNPHTAFASVPSWTSLQPIEGQVLVSFDIPKQEGAVVDPTLAHKKLPTGTALTPFTLEEREYPADTRVLVDVGWGREIHCEANPDLRLELLPVKGIVATIDGTSQT